MADKRKVPELLAPAGDWERLRMAVLYGADAVYLAGTAFGMRAFAGNFSPEELPKAVAFAHENGVKVHCTVNTMPRNSEVVNLPAHLELLQDAGVDALILADLGALYKGLPESANSGKIAIDLDADEVTTKLADEQVQKTLRSYTVIGKVLAADLLDTDKFQNHFLLTAASLGPQLLKSYDLGVDKDGNPATLSVDRIRDFFFDILSGKIGIQDLDGKFNISQIAGRG